MTDAPLISVIIATYNSSASLGLAVKSVLSQELQDFEILVIGDACTDDTEAVLRSLGDVRVRFTNLPQNTESQAGPNNEGHVARAVSTSRSSVTMTSGSRLICPGFWQRRT